MCLDEELVFQLNVYHTIYMYTQAGKYWYYNRWKRACEA